MQIAPLLQTNRLPYAVLPDIARHPAGSSLAPLLELALSQGNAQGVYLHRFDSDDLARLVAWAGKSPEIPALSATLRGGSVREHQESASLIVQHEAAWKDSRFRELPEFRKNRFAGVASIPLRHGGAVVGIVNVCRSSAVPWKPSELSFLLSLSIPVAALLVAEETYRSLQKEVERLTQQLAGRKLVERAKGLLQARFAWSEEEAYLYLRRRSRRLRTPMAELAQVIIQEEPGRHVE